MSNMNSTNINVKILTKPNVEGNKLKKAIRKEKKEGKGE